MPNIKIQYQYLFNKFDKLINCDFDSYVKQKSNVFLVTLSRENWLDSKCNCPYFLKNYVCEHIIALSVNEELVEIPLRYKNVQLTKKKKRGAKPKASTALKRMRTN